MLALLRTMKFKRVSRAGLVLVQPVPSRCSLCIGGFRPVRGAASRLTSSLNMSRWYLLVVDHSSTVLVESLLALGSKVLRVSASDVVNGKENIGYHCGLGITYLGKPGSGGTHMSSSPRLQLFYNGEPCGLCRHSLFMHYDCIS